MPVQSPLRLAVTTSAETFDRIRQPLFSRGIAVEHVQVDERVVALTGSNTAWSDSAFDVGYVYPSRVMEGAVASTLLDIPWVNGRDAILRSRNKAGILATLDRVDIPVPHSILVSNPVDQDALRDTFRRFEGPVVVKPNSTTRGVGVARAADLDSFLGIVDYLNLVHDFVATGDKAFLVQEYVPDARDLRVMVVDGTYVGAVERRLPDAMRADGQWKHNVHRGAIATGVTPDSQVIDQAEAVADLLDIAVVGVDFLLTDDRILVSETNARPTIDEETKYEPAFYDRLAATIHATAESERAG